MKYWITKYALTQGIYEIEGEIKEHTPRMCVRIKRSGGLPEYYHKPSWHETKASAVAYAKKLRSNKTAALEKQIQKLNSMEFT
jgi:hypothetical protein